MQTENSLFWKCAQVIAQILLRLLFDIQVRGRRNVPKRGGVLIVSNHQSNLDPVVLAAHLKRPLNFVAKSELFSNVFGAWILRRLNAFPLRQGKGDIGALKETIRRLREGHMLNIFPEGARSPDCQIHTFERGVALIIRRSRVPVIPAAIVGTYEAWPLQNPLWRTGSVRVRFGPPLSLGYLKSDEEITASVEREVRKLFQQLKGSIVPQEASAAPTFEINGKSRCGLGDNQPNNGFSLSLLNPTAAVRPIRTQRYISAPSVPESLHDA